MSKQKKFAWFNWIAGFAIGLMPLLAHVLLYVAAKPASGWSDNWAPDLLFITISNSGLAALSVFVKMAAGNLDMSKFSPVLIIVWVLLLLSFAAAALLYGVDVTGQGNASTWVVAVCLIVLSGICSLNFELAAADLEK
ncbi:MAG TPA: hypothetical protein VMH86_07110 [Rhizomicrobium sp.]|nr:hypothetical protein [Rhizomicrobium sp.]